VSDKRLKVMVLTGGPDRERDVSYASACQVTAALLEAGHDVTQRDVGPREPGALDDFKRWNGQCVFPVMHGSWGEGGALQRVLEQRGLKFVGAGARSARLCMDKHRAKAVLEEQGLPTPAFELLRTGQRRILQPPLVIKPPREGSSIDLYICRTVSDINNARRNLRGHRDELMVEKFVAGKELTVSVIGRPGTDLPHALPVIHIVPATTFYDYDAKYKRDDTYYQFDADDIGLSATTLRYVQRLAIEAHRALGCRHLSRVDFIVDERDQPWILEVNTIPGFTTHSLLPKAAARDGLPMPKLVDQLVRLAMRT
jgi:D-alanine-D-alanine ligase